jgi:phosphoribosylformylglycinamidine synthase PurS subunit
VYRSKIRVRLRRSILDVQGKAVQHAIASLGVNAVKDVRMGKYIELSLDGENEEQVRQTTDEVCRKLLANPVMEDYDFEIERV